MTPDSHHSPVRFGIAGIGRMGMFHVERLALRSDSRAIAANDLEASRKASAEGLGVRFFESWESFLQDPDIEVVIIATPPATHATLALEALTAGKHVAVEPPLSLTREEADSLLDESRKRDRMLFVMQNWRWDDDFQTARNLVDSEKLGELQAIKHIVWDYGFPVGGRPHGREGWRADATQGAGVLVEFGAHHFDQLLALTGIEPLHVFARLSKRGSEPVPEDGYSVFLEFPGEVTAHLEINLQSFAPLQTGWMITGSRGSYHKFQHASVTNEGEIFHSRLEPQPADWDQIYVGIFRHLREDAPLPISPEHSRRVVALLEAVRRSAESGQVVDLKKFEE